MSLARVQILQVATTAPIFLAITLALYRYQTPLTRPQAATTTTTTSTTPAQAATPVKSASAMGSKSSKTDSNWQSLHGQGAASNLAVFGAGCYWGTE
eukprot:scaffold76912_cov45-Prasinocladus_malaysianus.AAC.1